jgi:hypothetical protein
VGLAVVAWWVLQQTGILIGLVSSGSKSGSWVMDFNGLNPQVQCLVCLVWGEWKSWFELVWFL